MPEFEYYSKSEEYDEKNEKFDDILKEMYNFLQKLEISDHVNFLHFLLKMSNR
jgi:hypothetical protein